MVDLSGGGPGGLIEHGISNAVFIVPAILIIGLVGFFVYKLVDSLRSKEKRKEEKKKLKQQRREKDGKPKKRQQANQYSNGVADSVQDHVEKKARA